MKVHRYLAFGLVVQSAHPIASLAVSELSTVGSPDVEIVEGEVRFPSNSQNADGTEVSFDGESFFLYIEECGRFQVIGGRKIVVQPEPGATADQINLYLLGSVFGVLLHQRKLLPFHCNAVEHGGSAFLFCGDSGAGKSTLAAYFAERGFHLLSDDLCALHFSGDGRLIANRGVARLKLWQDTLSALGRTSEGLSLVPWYEDKFEVPLTGTPLAEPLPVAAIFHLRVAEDGRLPGIHPLKGLEAANSVTANIYRRRMADLMGGAPAYLAIAAQIIDRVPIFSMNRVWGLQHFRKEALAAEEHMRRIALE